MLKAPVRGHGWQGSWLWVNLQVREAETFPLTALSVKTEKEVAKHQNPSTLLAGENMQRNFAPSS